jgi:hypothetical protein
MSGRSSVPPEASLSVAVATSAKPVAGRRAEAGAPPLFVHSSWRTSSTWLWAKLRRAPTTFAYGEIFHERLERLTIDQLRESDFSRWNSNHPESAPYFLEFAQLIERDGAMRGYDRSMAFERFIPEDGLAGSLSAAERAYIEGLIEHAYSRRKIPVLTDTRTLGRFAALAEAFPGRHVLLVRNAFHQWGSYAEQWAQGNNYFLDMLCKTVEASRRDPFVRLLSDWFVDEDRSPNSAATFQLFLLFHLYLYAHAFDSADLVVDVNEIATLPEHRVVVEERLSEWVLSPVDLSDARPAFGLSLFSVTSKVAFVDVIDQFVKQMIDRSMSADAAQFVTRAKDEALAEWERHEFYNRTFRAFALRRPRLAEEGPENRAALPAQSAAGEGRPDQSTDRPGVESDRKTKGWAKPKAKPGRPRAAATKRPSRSASKAKPTRRRGAPKRKR